MRELAAAGKSVLFYTSELEEIQLACDRAIVIFGGRVVDVLPVEIADEAALTRAAYGLPRDATPMSACWPSLGRGARAMIAFIRRNTWVIGLCALFVLLLVVTKIIQPKYGANDFGSLVRAVLPYAFAVAAQAIVVIGGGIDLSVASMMAVTSVTAAVLMNGASEEFALVVIPLVLRARLLPRRAQRHPHRPHPRARYRRHPRDAVRLPGRRAAHPRLARRRRGALAQGDGRRHDRDPRRADLRSRCGSPTRW